MAHSNLGSVENATRIIMEVNPQMVLDIGVGFGMLAIDTRISPQRAGRVAGGDPSA